MATADKAAVSPRATNELDDIDDAVDALAALAAKASAADDDDSSSDSDSEDSTEVLDDFTLTGALFCPSSALLRSVDRRTQR